MSNMQEDNRLFKTTEANDIDSITNEANGANIKNNVQNHQTSNESPDFTIIWQNLTFKVDSRPWPLRFKERIFHTNRSSNSGLNLEAQHDEVKREKTILNGICGDVKSRQLTGILGPSGAGKSTLLYCLFQNRTYGTSGRILVDGTCKKRLKVCFIPQKDYLNDYLTVREDLIFVSKLRLPTLDTDPMQNGSGTNQNISREKLNQDDVGETYVKQEGRRCKTKLIDHEANALRVADLLGITNCLDVPIKNISGGQKKRLSIARELMSKPDILILDEPTTGLDSVTCQKTMMVLRDLAQHSSHPMAVIVTIHQPQRSVFNMLDKAYFLNNKGQVVFEDKPTMVADKLKDIAKLSVPAAKYNPAAALIEILSNPGHTQAVDLLSNNQRTRFNEKYNDTYLKKIMQNKFDSNSWKLCAINGRNSNLSEESVLDEQTRAGGLRPPLESITDISRRTDEITVSSASTPKSEDYFISYQLKDCISSHKDNHFLRSLRHVFILTHRSWLSVIRNPTHLKSRLLFHASLPLIMLMIFGTTSGTPNSCPTLGAELQLSDLQKSLDDGIIKRNIDETRLTFENISFFFILIYGFSINIISSTASHYPLTIHMFKKETINGLYSAGPHFIGQMLAELPLEILYPTLSLILGYSLSGQIRSYLEWRMFAVTLIMILVCYTVHSLGLLCGSIFINDINVAVLIGQVSLFPPILLSGFVIRTSRMSDWMLKLSAFSYYKHALLGIVAARYGFNVCDCDEDMIPENGKSISFAGMPPNIKHVLDYMFPPNQTDGLVVSEVFDKLSERFSKAQTFALDINSCADVRPYAMTAFNVEDSHLYTAALAMLSMIVAIKITTFTIVRMSPYRID